MAQAQRDEERRAEQSANQLRRDAEERQYREQQAEAQARRDTLLIAALTSLGDFAKNQAAAAAVLATPKTEVAATETPPTAGSFSSVFVFVLRLLWLFSTSSDFLGSEEKDGKAQPQEHERILWRLLAVAKNVIDALVGSQKTEAAALLAEINATSNTNAQFSTTQRLCRRGFGNTRQMVIAALKDQGLRDLPVADVTTRVLQRVFQVEACPQLTATAKFAIAAAFFRTTVVDLEALTRKVVNDCVSPVLISLAKRQPISDVQHRELAALKLAAVALIDMKFTKTEKVEKADASHVHARSLAPQGDRQQAALAASPVAAHGQVVSIGSADVDGNDGGGSEELSSTRASTSLVPTRAKKRKPVGVAVVASALEPVLSEAAPPLKTAPSKKKAKGNTNRK